MLEILRPWPRLEFGWICAVLYRTGRPDKTLPDKPCCNWLSAGAEQGPGAAEIRDGTAP